MRSIRLPFSNYDHDFDEYILTNSPGERWPRNSRAADSGLVNMLLMQPALMEAIDQKLDNESGPFYGL
ncbi:uncharacterized protein N7473_011924 [Penicillium subrubescens]|jgi:hypothetical protein|uniref:uncharacterized protein n=1 Tax=Penicillium subrubescens TaxID=1316194 RepID=UPI00254502E1|nr:uncharacterized protein N7473_011924 [Penicillium subrubescens]KAJ5880871.1 hypothetical protein N7473_011924 [Penicillium subrubescens]